MLLTTAEKKEKGSCLRRGAAAKQLKATEKKSLDNINLKEEHAYGNADSREL